MATTSQRLLESPLCERIFAGRYTELLKETVDSPAGAYAPLDTPFVVGALAFSGRQDEAVAAFRWWAKEHGDDATVRVASHFFLGLGECRSGRYASAIAHARAAVAASERGEALHAFFAHQTIGLLRHFTGRARSAARHAAKARQAALEARFPYGRMLALDLLGHALVLEGQIHAGMSVLEQSAELASSLGLVANAGAPRTAVAAYSARFGVAGFDAPKVLTELVAAVKPEDAYSRRMLLSELAIQQAFAGDGQAARDSIDEAARIALPDGDRRAKVRLLVADAIVLGLSRGAAAAREKTSLARAMLDPELDDGLDVEVTWAEALVRGALRAPDGAERARIAALARRTHVGRARLMAAIGDELAALDPHEEDRVAALVRAIEHDPDEARHRIVSQGIWGWLPRLFGVDPGRRIFLLHAESLLVVEDHGAVAPLEMPGAVLVRLLDAIATRAMTKDELVMQVWGIKAYRAERHDPLVHTTVSRLRTALGPAGAWIRVTDAGYAMSEGVALMHLGGAIEGVDPPTLEDERPRSSAPSGAEARQKAADARREEIARLLAREPLSTSEIATQLGISEMTAFRVLSVMVKDGVIERTGQGKRTRYRVAS
ncbi:MAG: winged helix-turn-helix transcriptional regulator [Labilithrix sp.]|nr:winged helix-turn-helix transcriptional regulator [Labilithrix sp.]